MPTPFNPSVIFDDVEIVTSNYDLEPCPHCQGFGFVLYSSLISGDTCAAPLAVAPVEVALSNPLTHREGSLEFGNQTGQGGELYCYQCEQVCNYLFADSRCSKCTRLTPEEVRGLPDA